MDNWGEAGGEDTECTDTKLGFYKVERYGTDGRTNSDEIHDRNIDGGWIAQPVVVTAAVPEVTGSIPALTPRVHPASNWVVEKSTKIARSFP
uniref:Uncharacterized protein n=1 Tax=Caenorhabditis japonica TaxID=281687 RepID=A0A8R1IHK8_CAEJA